MVRFGTYEARSRWFALEMARDFAPFKLNSALTLPRSYVVEMACLSVGAIGMPL